MQFFVGTKTLVADVYGMKTNKKFINALEENIRKRGAMEKLISDSAQSQISNRVKNALRKIFIDDWKFDPHYQHQNFSERRYQNVKRQTNTLLYRTSAPSCTCLLAMIYVCFVLNHAYNSTIENIPANEDAGSTCDV